MKTITLFDSTDAGRYQIPNKLSDFADFINGLLAQVPPEHAPDATVEIDAEESYGSAYYTFKVSYERPFTESEAAENLLQENKERARRKQHLLVQAERIRREAEKL